jgi:hypothetical protein
MEVIFSPKKYPIIYRLSSYVQLRSLSKELELDIKSDVNSFYVFLLRIIYLGIYRTTLFFHG